MVLVEVVLVIVHKWAVCITAQCPALEAHQRGTILPTADRLGRIPRAAEIIGFNRFVTLAKSVRTVAVPCTVPVQVTRDTSAVTLAISRVIVAVGSMRTTRVIVADTTCTTRITRGIMADTTRTQRVIMRGMAAIVTTFAPIVVTRIMVTRIIIVRTRVTAIAHRGIQADEDDPAIPAPRTVAPQTSSSRLLRRVNRLKCRVHRR